MSDAYSSIYAIQKTSTFSMHSQYQYIIEYLSQYYQLPSSIFQATVIFSSDCFLRNYGQS